MHAVQERLKDTAGATLSVALLFFIMCAAAGSVILAAATTTSGRLSELEATDQNYYAVVSAARLLRDEINGQTLGVKQTETKTVITTREEKKETDESGAKHTVVEETTETKYTYDAPTWFKLETSTKDEDSDDNTSKLGTINEKSIKTLGDGDVFFLLDALKNETKNSNPAQERTGALTTVNKETSSTESYTSKTELYNTSKTKAYDDNDDDRSAFTSKLMNDSAHVYTDTWQISANLGTSFSGTLPVDVRIIMDARGSITAYLKNHTEGTTQKGNEYRLKLTLDAQEGTKETSGNSETTSSSSGTASSETETTETTRYSYVSWTNPKIMKDTSYEWKS